MNEHNFRYRVARCKGPPLEALQLELRGKTKRLYVVGCSNLVYRNGPRDGIGRSGNNNTQHTQAGWVGLTHRVLPSYFSASPFVIHEKKRVFCFKACSVKRSDTGVAPIYAQTDRRTVSLASLSLASASASHWTRGAGFLVRLSQHSRRLAQTARPPSSSSSPSHSSSPLLVWPSRLPSTFLTAQNGCSTPRQGRQGLLS